MIKNIMTPTLTKIFDAFEKKGFQLFIVGGAVRDMLLGKSQKDCDLTTNAKPDDIQQIANEKGWKTLAIGEAFNISFIVVDGEQFEVATFRKDLTRGRKPETAFGTIEDDVARRDLTINAMFLNRHGKLTDLVGGELDMKNKLIRCVGSAEDRFSDDPLRKIRAVRFAANLGFKIEDATLAAIVKDPSLTGVSRERIIAEFQKVKKFNRFMELLDQTGLFEVIFGFENKSNEKISDELTSTSFIAKMFSLNGKIVKESVLTMVWKMTNVSARSVLLLLSLEQFFKGEVRNIRRIKNLLKDTDLVFEDFLNFFESKLKHKAEVFWKMELPNFSDKLMADGLKGKELGNEIEKLDIEFFNNQI